MLVNPYIKSFEQYLYLVFTGLLLLATLIQFDWRTELVTALLLFLPLLDTSYKKVNALGYVSAARWHLFARFFLLAAFTLLVLLPPQNIQFALITLFLVALPEEWFFRAYLMTQLESALTKQQLNTQYKAQEAGSSAGLLKAIPVSLLANLIASLFFALMHLPLQGLWGLMVFFPSLFLGFLYQRDNDLFIVVCVHALFNLLYINYLVNYIF